MGEIHAAVDARDNDIGGGVLDAPRLRGVNIEVVEPCRTAARRRDACRNLADGGHASAGMLAGRLIASRLWTARPRLRAGPLDAIARYAGSGKTGPRNACAAPGTVEIGSAGCARIAASLTRPAALRVERTAQAWIRSAL